MYLKDNDYIIIIIKIFSSFDELLSSLEITNSNFSH